MRFSFNVEVRLFNQIKTSKVQFICRVNYDRRWNNWSTGWDTRRKGRPCPICRAFNLARLTLLDGCWSHPFRITSGVSGNTHGIGIDLTQI